MLWGFAVKTHFSVFCLDLEKDISSPYESFVKCELSRVKFGIMLFNCEGDLFKQILFLPLIIRQSDNEM